MLATVVPLGPASICMNLILQSPYTFFDFFINSLPKAAPDKESVMNNKTENLSMTDPPTGGKVLLLLNTYLASANGR